jgi:hypothetical protein
VFVIEIPAPESALHPHANHDGVQEATAIFVLVVFVLVLGRWLVRMFQQDGTEIHLA